MAMRRTTSIGALLTVALLALAACSSGDGPSDDGERAGTQTDDAAVGCSAGVEAIATATERYVRGYESGRAVSAEAATAPGGAATPDPDAEAAVLTDEEFQAALSEAQATLAQRRCDPASTRADLAAALGRISPGGPVADAVLRQLTAGLTGTGAREPATVAVRPGEDLRDAVARVADGSTVELQPGEHRLDGPLVLLGGVELRGAGTEATTIVSTAAEAVVLVLTDQRVELTGLSVRHEGDEPASVVLGGPSASLVVTEAKLTGARTDPDGFGGAGILMYADDDAAAGRGTTLEVTDAELRGNEAAGIVLSGGHRSSIVRGVIAENGQCGVCFVGPSTGSIEDTRFEDNTIGIAVTGTAAPTLLRIAIEGGEVGLQASDAAAPTVQTATISGAARAAAIYTQTAAGTLDEVTCQEVPFGLVLDPGARPLVGAVDCTLTSGA